MNKGKFISFNVPYKDGNGKSISETNQATAILDEAATSIKNGAAGVGIIYSANYNQTRVIEETYFGGNWNTNTSGAHQAVVIMQIELLLASSYQALQGKMHILPLTTMNAYSGDAPLAIWNKDVHTGIINQDLDRVQRYLNCGWDILGWQNQDSVKDAHNPYAIGGSIANMDPTVSDFIQAFLIKLAANYK